MAKDHDALDELLAHPGRVVAERWEWLGLSHDIARSNGLALAELISSIEGDARAIMDTMIYRGTFSLVQPAFSTISLHLTNHLASVTALIDHLQVIQREEPLPELKVAIAECHASLRKKIPSTAYYVRLRHFTQHVGLPVLNSSLDGGRGTIWLFHSPMVGRRGTNGEKFSWSGSSKEFVSAHGDPFPLRDLVLDVCTSTSAEYESLHRRVGLAHLDVLSDYASAREQRDRTLRGTGHP